jgi:hypothetical protein
MPDLRRRLFVGAATLAVVGCLLCPPSSAAATGPVRVLYFDAAGTEQTAVGPLHAAMRDLGRDAIWFDYATGPTPGADVLGRYDALALIPRPTDSPRSARSSNSPLARSCPC